MNEVVQALAIEFLGPEVRTMNPNLVGVGREGAALLHWDLHPDNAILSAEGLPSSIGRVPATARPADSSTRVASDGR